MWMEAFKVVSMKKLSKKDSWPAVSPRSAPGRQPECSPDDSSLTGFACVPRDTPVPRSHGQLPTLVMPLLNTQFSLSPVPQSSPVHVTSLSPSSASALACGQACPSFPSGQGSVLCCGEGS